MNESVSVTKQSLSAWKPPLNLKCKLDREADRHKAILLSACQTAGADFFDSRGPTTHEPTAFAQVFAREINVWQASSPAQAPISAFCPSCACGRVALPSAEWRSNLGRVGCLAPEAAGRRMRSPVGSQTRSTQSGNLGSHLREG